MISDDPSSMISSETRTSSVILICFVVAVGGFLFGYDLVIVSGAQLSVTKYFAIQQGSPAHGLVISIASLGCILGSFLGMFLCDAMGRRRTWVLAAPAPGRV